MALHALHIADSMLLPALLPCRPPLFETSYSREKLHGRFAEYRQKDTEKNKFRGVQLKGGVQTERDREKGRDGEEVRDKNSQQILKHPL